MKKTLCNPIIPTILWRILLNVCDLRYSRNQQQTLH